MNNKPTDLTKNDLPDELNPDYIYRLTASKLLIEIATGKINTIEIAKEELRNRGLNENGEWVGFK